MWLFVRIHMMNQNASLAACEDVLAAVPTRATRVTMNGNHTDFFNLELSTQRAPSAIRPRDCMRSGHHSAELRSMAAALATGLLCLSCGHGLPNEPVFIIGRSTTQDSPYGRVYTSLGGKVSMQAGDPEIGLMHVLILPPSDHELVRSTAALEEGAPEILRFEWEFSNGKAAKLAISHDSEKHVVSVSGQHYPLSKGNLFVAQANDQGAIEFRQLSRTLFECLEAGKALAEFKREFPTNERVQKIHE